MCEAAREAFAIEWEPLEMTAGLGRLIEALRAAKYGQTSYNQKR